MAQALCQAMGLRLHPLDYARLLERLADCRRERLPSEARYRLLKLGLEGADAGQWVLRLGARHHLALAVLAGMALSGLGWGMTLLLNSNVGSEAVYQTEVFQQQVIEADHGEHASLAVLGS